LLVGLSTLVVTQNVLSHEMVYAATQLILVVGGWFLIGYFLMPPLFKRIGDYINQETLTIISIALCLILVCVAANFHYSNALGAFIMGSILAETHLVNRIEINVQPIRDIFAAVFFITVGMLIDPTVIIQHWFAVIVVTLITIFGKIMVTSLGVLLTGKPISVASRVGFSMAQIGEFSFIIVALGASLKVISKELYPIVVAVSALTTFTTPYLIRLSGHFSAGIENRLPKRTVNWLERYAKWIYQTTKPSDNRFFLAALSRILINAILVAIIFKLAHYLVLARIITHFNPKWFWSAICLWIAFILASPFIWGMLFSFRASKPQYVWQLRLAVSCIWLITIAELGLLSWVYIYAWQTIAMFVGFAVLFFIIFHHHIARYYYWFEKQMIENVKKEVHKK
jgi:monovalent cation:H+ antiporter-2, CPA2 family